MVEWTSRERMRRTLALQPADHVPCCMMSFTALRKRVNEDWYALARAELEMGLDAMLFIPTAPRPARPDHPDLRGLPVHFAPEVRVSERRERRPGEADLLHKEYVTPRGVLSTSIRLSEDWPHGEHIPFVDDYQVPRSIKPLVTGPQDLDALSYLLTPPSDQDVALFYQEAATAHDFSTAYGVLLAGGWGVGMDMANWLCGMERLMILALEEPTFVTDLLEMIHRWNLARMQVVLDGGVDLYIRRAWYEGVDFVTTRFYREAILPRLRAEADWVHERGAKFGYICSSGTRPLLDAYLESGIDVLIGIDPVQGTHTDMALIKDKLGGRVCRWGGVSGAVTVEMGSEEDVRAAVRQAIQTLGPDGLILAPVDNITVDEPRTWQNMAVLIDEWQKQR